ncbi:cytochrome c oxidase subunit II [Paludisphaera soli]|uniref:cytochrome c oxidase subunit II n=1 Tax=Paludisphaera soli TaxID=2712865 RepID=UPI0013EC5DE5|nr:cytochrome c oxidase subunit II [Paludisphaera soli]
MRYWSLIFALAAVFSVGAFAYAPFSADWWLPNPAGEPYHSVSTFGREIDALFLIILVLTGAVFIGTQAALVWAQFRYADRIGEDGLPVRPAQYFHGSQRLEVIWTVIPAGILVFLALYQMDTWAKIKFRSASPRTPVLAEVTGRQFQWAMKYPGPDGRLGTPDDLFTVNDLHLVKDQTALIHLKSADVIHSFFLPQMRIKQDAVPGMAIPVWFDCDRAGRFELACAELCGWGHYKMRGDVVVHETEAEFQAWQAAKLAEQGRSQIAGADEPEGDDR